MCPKSPDTRIAGGETEKESERESEGKDRERERATERGGGQSIRRFPKLAVRNPSRLPPPATYCVTSGPP